MLIWIVLAILTLSVVILLIGYARDSAKAFYGGLAVALLGVILLVVLAPAIDHETFKSKENTYYMRGNKCVVYTDESVMTYTVDRITDTVILNGVKTSMTTDEFFEKLEREEITLAEE